MSKHKYVIGFESGKLSYSDYDVDLYNSGVNQILSVAASRGHDIVHFSREDLMIKHGVPSARVSLLEKKIPTIPDNLYTHMHLYKSGELTIPLNRIHVYMIRGDDIKPGMENLDLLKEAENHSIFLEDVEDTLNTTDKYDLVLRCSDVPQPVTIKADSITEAYEALNKVPLYEGKAVLKDRFGYGCGEQVHLLRTDKSDIHDKIEKYVSDYRHVIIQEFCPEVSNGDLVLTFFDGKHIGAMRRLSSEGEWKTNASLGAVEVAHTPTAELEDIARRVVRKYPGCRFSSVDMLDSGKVIEINAFPGGKGLLKTYGVSVGTIIMDQIENDAYQFFKRNKESARKA